MTHALRSLAVALLASLPVGCVQIEYMRNSSEAPIPESAVAALRVGASDLQACLDALGAPLFVYRQANGGVVLAYGFRESSGWGISGSYTPREYGSVSLAFDSDTANIDGYVLQFDDAWQLTALQRGNLRDLTGDAQVLRSRRGG